MDPRSLLLPNPPHVLETPSLNDDSKCPSPDRTWGEAAVERHDASPDPVQRDRTGSVSDASQNVAGGGVARDDFFSDSSPVSGISSPLLDDESGNNTSISPISQGSAVLAPAGTGAASVFVAAANLSNVAPGIASVGPILTPDGQYMCPQCPRIFDGFLKAR